MLSTRNGMSSLITSRIVRRVAQPSVAAGRNRRSFGRPAARSAANANTLRTPRASSSPPRASSSTGATAR